MWIININMCLKQNNIVKIFNGNNISFQCSESNNKGYITASGERFRYTRNNEIFIPIGMDVEFGNWGNNLSAFKNYTKYFNEIADNGGNTASIALINHVGLDIEWEYLGKYESPDYKINGDETLWNRLAHSWEIDNVIDLAKQLDLKLKFTMLFHNVFRDSCDDCYWSSNPYRDIQGVNNPIDFFTNQTAKDIYLKKVRYIIARWGYSTNILWWELLTEIDNVTGFKNNDHVFRNWFSEIAAELKELDNRKHMISSSYATAFKDNNPNSWIFNDENCDIINLHSYSKEKKGNFDRFQDIKKVKKELGSIDKPFIFGEMGTVFEIEEATDVQFHNNIWATSFMGCAGPGLNWFWDVMLPNGYAQNFAPLNEFLSKINFNKNWKYKRFPLFNGLTLYGRNYSTENFYMNEHNQKSSVGWIHNATHYWYNLGLPILYFSNGDVIEANDDDDYSSPVIFYNDYAKIAGLNLLKKYCLTPYSIMSNHTLQEQSSKTMKSNIAGQILIATPEYFNIAHDFAYILSIGECNKTDFNVIESDTLYCPIDTLSFDGVYENDTLGIYTYFWDFGNGEISTLVHPKVFYENSGVYTITLIVHDTLTSFSDTLHQNIVVMNCDAVNKNIRQNLKDKLLMQNISNKQIDNIRIYPNPSTGVFTIANSSENCEVDIYIYDILGSLLINNTIKLTGKNILNLSGYGKGMYLMKISNGQYIKTFKLIVI